MKILVTGGAGFIGSNFIHYWLLNHLQDKIVNLDALTYAGNLDNLKDVAANSHYSFIKGDIRDRDIVEQAMAGCDVVVHFAAESHNSRAVLNPTIFFQTNVLGTQTLLEVAKTEGIQRFHHISTCEVYGDLPLESRESFSENSAYKPRTPYNASKAGADLAVRAYFETFHLPITISNCCNNYGPYQFPEKLIPYFTIKALKEEKMPLYKSSKNKREWLHVDDHCAAIETVLLRGKIGETYNVGSSFEADIETIADTILQILGLDKSYKSYVEDRPGHDRRYLLNSEKIIKELGWQPKIPFKQGLEKTIKWYQDNKWWYEKLLDKLEVNEDQWAK